MDTDYEYCYSMESDNVRNTNISVSKFMYNNIRRSLCADIPVALKLSLLLAASFSQTKISGK